MAKSGFDNAFSIAFREIMQIRALRAPILAQQMAAAGHPGPKTDTLYRWLAGRSLPRSGKSVDFVMRVEKFLDLTPFELTDRLHRDAKLYARNRRQFSYQEVHALAWYLPDNFHQLAKAKKEEILAWISAHTGHGQTDYRRYLGTVRRQHFSLRFPDAPIHYRRRGVAESRRSPLVRDAPPALQKEMSELLAFRLNDLVPAGFSRLGKWKPATAAHHVGNMGRFFGALSCDPTSTSKGAGVPLETLTFAMIAVPSFCDWYLTWRERRRGFYSTNEFGLLIAFNGMLQPRTGWIRQSPSLADRLQPVDGFLTQSEIDRMRSDWNAACDRMLVHLRSRTNDIKRVMKSHRDPAEPILPILNAEDPAEMYRRIEDQIIRWKPSERSDPMGAAEATRDFLLFHVALRSGLRQRNLREMLLASPDSAPTSKARLESLGRGEMRWNEKARRWELYMPLSAFKNAGSRFFGGQPMLIDLGGVERFDERMSLWVRRHRTRLIGPAPDPGTMFVTKGRRIEDDVSMSVASITHHWYRITRKYGIYNPYTGRGAVEGLMPHGPHNVRDVRATHVLKATGSYELASYAVHDTAGTIERHYGRFLPGEKAKKASDILNAIWSNEMSGHKRRGK
ncbi:hypothetical protein [Aureimonas altamirensis]|uniref:hypothetical protein n=1 Tax=Aureimonas altamirensis TaxID=370622 RepID=UPI0030183CFB